MIFSFCQTRRQLRPISKFHAKRNSSFQQEKENLSTPPPPKRKSKIMFGPQLTPEEFDKKMPPVAPISKGRTPPRRGSTGYSILKGTDKSKTAGVLADVEKSPEQLSAEQASTGTPVKSKEIVDTTTTVNLNEEKIEAVEEEPKIYNVEKLNESQENTAALENQDPDVLSTTISLDESVLEDKEPNNLNCEQVIVSHITSPAISTKTSEIVSDVLDKTSTQEEPETEEENDALYKSRVSLGSSILSSEDNIVIYSSASEEESILNKTDCSAPEKSQLNSTINDFLTAESPAVSKLDESQNSEIVNLEMTGSPAVCKLNESQKSEIVNLEMTGSPAVSKLDESQKAEIVNLKMTGSPAVCELDESQNSEIVNLKMTGSTAVSELDESQKSEIVNLEMNRSPAVCILDESQKSDIVNLEISNSSVSSGEEPDLYVSGHNISTKSEIIDLNKSVNTEPVEEIAAQPRLSTGSSNFSTESYDNIVIYNTPSEGSEMESDATKLDESVVTEPGLNTTIDDFLKENKKSSSTVDMAEVAEIQINVVPENKTPAVRRSTRKSVRFGPMLSPEEYDRDMPADTPIRRGALPGRYSVPNPQLSAGRTPLRKSVAVCASSAGMLKLDESMESLDSLDSLDSENQDSATRARTQRRKTMTPKEIKANLSWAEIKSDDNSDLSKKEHVDSPLVTRTPKAVPRADALQALVSMHYF